MRSRGSGCRPRATTIYVAPGAQLIGDVRLGEGASVWFNAVLRADDECIEIGAGSNVQDATVIHCDVGQPTRVGRNVTIGHRVLLHGCSIGDDTLIGNGAIVLDGARIGSRCLVGAGAMVTPGKEIPRRERADGRAGARGPRDRRTRAGHDRTRARVRTRNASVRYQREMVPMSR